MSGLLEQAGDVDSGSEEDAILRLGEKDIDSVRSLIGAEATADLMHKVYRFAAVSMNPGATLARLFRQDPDAFVVLAFELASYRLFMDGLAAGGANADVRTLVDAVERRQRRWVSGLVARFRDPGDLLPETDNGAS